MFVRTVRLPTLDALRGVAIVTVVSSHVFWLFAEKDVFAGANAGFVASPLTFLSRGSVGVQLFFLLSGFVLALPYLQGRRRMESWAEYRSFCLRRCARLLPLYTLAWLLPLFWFYAGDPLASHGVQVSALVTMASAFFPSTFQPRYNIVLWSLCIEFWLSLLLPLCLLALRRMGQIRTALAAILLAGISRFAAVLLVHTFGTNVLMSGVTSQLDVFVLGIVLAQRHTDGARSRHCGLQAVFGLFCVWTGPGTLEGVAQGFLRWEGIPLSFTLLTIGLTCCTDAAVSARVCCHGMWYPLRQLGRMCYSVYAWHIPLMLICMSWGYFTDAWVFSAYLLSLLIVTVFSYRYVEFGHIADPRPLFGLPARGAQATPLAQVREAALA